jgi:hypothetical protein
MNATKTSRTLANAVEAQARNLLMLKIALSIAGPDFSRNPETRWG